MRARLPGQGSALEVANVPLARTCLERFFHAGPRATQHLARAYFALGRVQSAEAEGLKAQALADATLAALAQVQQGLQVAVELGASYRFLVYNASVWLWRIARPLVASDDGAAKLVPVLEKVLKALDDAQEADAGWRLQLSMELARCLECAGKKKEAAALLGGCGALAAQVPKATQEVLLQRQVHMAADDAGAVKKLRDDQKEALRDRACVIVQSTPRSRSRRARAAARPPRAEIDDAIKVLDDELHQAMHAEGDVAQNVGALKGSSAHDDLLLMLAMQAARLGRLDQAWHCANRCGTSKALAVRVRSSYVREMVRVAQLDHPKDGAPPQGEVYTRLMVGTRIDALKRLEDTLASARRTNDAELVQEGCVLIWNISLPLLQPSLVSHAMRALTLACASLEAVESPMHEVRVALHLELARAEAAADFMARAKEHVDKGLLLDVPLNEFGERPLDRPLLALQQALALKLDVYRDAETAEEKAINLLEQVRVAKQPKLKAQLCTQLCALLTASDDAAAARRAADAADEATGAAPPRAPARRRRPTPRRWRGGASARRCGRS